MIQKTHCIGEVDADPDEEATKMADSPGSVVQVALSAISLPIEIEKRINVTVASGFFEKAIYTPLKPTQKLKTLLTCRMYDWM